MLVRRVSMEDALSKSREDVVVSVVGATGAVGRQLLTQLEIEGYKNVRAVASPRSAGRQLPYAGRSLTVEALAPEVFDGVDISLFSAGGARSREIAPAAVERGAVVVDNSSAFRMVDNVPLVVSEVNADAVRAHKGIIANPNCSTTQMVLPLQALQQAVGLERVLVSTYQSASGAGQGGIDELREGLQQLVAGQAVTNSVFARPLAGDCVPHIGTFQPNLYTDEELKMTYETRKIMGLPDLDISATCVRVPVERGHMESLTVDLAAPLTAQEAREVFAAFPGLVVLDSPSDNVYPLARECVGRRETFVGRVRVDVSRPSTLHFWVVADNLLKGAAWNAVQIANTLLEKDALSVA